MARRRAPSRSTRSGAAARRRARRSGAAFARLVGVMTTLRSPVGCPWDRRQSHTSLRPYLLEETYEALDAIDRRDLDALRGELGDVLFQVVFHAEIARSDGRFDAADVVEDVTAKLVRRHPHVFTPDGRPLGRARLGTPGAVLEQWERIKAREQVEAGGDAGVLAGIPRSLPALLRAHKIGKRAATVGFDWPKTEHVLDKIDEEVRELRRAVAQGEREAFEEMGDVLFSLANLSRKLGIEPEAALARANDKFTRRFAAVERRLAAASRTVHDATLDELERAWEAVKRRAARRSSPTVRRTSSAPSPRVRRSR
jgi:MazG family protein